MILTLGLTIGFGKSDNLAAAYGIAVSATMLMTSVLLFIAMREVWNWPIWAAGAVAALFIVIDASFLAANMAKVFQGGWVPLLLASIVYGVMWIWHRGAQAVHKRVEFKLTPRARPCSSPAPRTRCRRSCHGMCATIARCMNTCLR